MLKRIKISNFRCLKNFEIEFEDDLTLIVGENDSGKTSLVDALKIVLQGKRVEIEDFYYGTNRIEIEIKLNDKKYLSEHILDGNRIASKIYLTITHESLSEIKQRINSEDFNETNNFNEAKEIASMLNISFRKNTRFDTLKNNIIDKINELLGGDNPAKFESNISNITTYFLDGKHFEDISLFINEIFFKEKRKSIWSESAIEEDITIEMIIRNKLDSYASQIQEDLEACGIKDKIQEFLPQLTEIAVTSDFEPKDLNINVSVKMLENGKEIPISKKGDGTKRRITMALLDYKLNYHSGSSIYVLDEADTHLHVKAQLELINIMKGLAEDGKQIIITTHSPFLINTCKPQQIRLLRNINNETQTKYLRRDYQVDRLLRNLGIENTYLFFARKILIVEGETEEKFIPIIFENLFNSNLYSNLIKIINVKGIKNVPGFARAILELNNKNNIYALIDNDADEITSELINQLELDNDHIFKLGNKEFEDSFQPYTIYKCWKQYVESCGKEIGENWTEDNIRLKREECITNNTKFSKELRRLNIGCQKKFDKTTLGIALGEYCTKEELDENLCKLLYILKQ